MKGMKRQRGLGFLSAILLVGIVIFMGVLLFQIGPLYIEYFNVKSSVNSLQSDPTAAGSVDDPTEIVQALKSSLFKRLDINGVTRVTRENAQITNTPQGYLVKVSYDAQTNVMYNIYALIKFDYQVLVQPNVASKGN